MNIFDGYSIPNAPINNMENVFNDKHLLERGSVKNVNHPIDGEIKIVGLPVEFSRDKEVNEIRMYPPMLGEHIFCILKIAIQLIEWQIIGLNLYRVIVYQVNLMIIV